MYFYSVRLRQASYSASKEPALSTAEIEVGTPLICNFKSRTTYGVRRQAASRQVLNSVYTAAYVYVPL